MAIIIPTQTLGSEYTHVFSEDDALARPEPTGDEERDKAAAAEFDERYARAMETGDFAAVLCPGKEPSVITLRRFSNRRAQQFADLIARIYNRDGTRTKDANAAVYDLVRVCVDRVSGMELETESDPEWGQVLTDAALGKLSRVHSLLPELHARILLEASIAAKKK